MNASAKKTVLIVASNPAVGPLTGWPIGFWMAEVTHPYAAFVEAGYDVEIRSPEGGALQADAMSDPEDESRYAADDLLSLGFKKSPSHAALLEDTASLADVDVADYDAVLLAGGQGPMVTFHDNEALGALVASFYEAGKPTALLCHGTCVLLRAKLANGELLAKGKTWTGFSNEEEQIVDASVGQRVQPFWIESAAREMPDTSFVVGPAWAPFAVRDGHLITGQQQTSGRLAAELVIEALSGVPSSAPTTRAAL